MKIAIVHDYLNQYGGAERVVEVLHEIFPEAPIYTSVYLPDNLPDSFKQMDIRTTFMQGFPFIDKLYKKYLMFYPFAMRSLNVKKYDLIISSSSSFAKGVKKRKDALHICYCYTPTRFIWYYDFYIKKERYNKIILLLLPLFIRFLKRWDLNVIKGIDEFIAISKNIQQKIKKCYNRNSIVIYPPVDLSKFDIIENAEKSEDDYFLIVSRLNSYKNLDLVIKAINKVSLNLKIIGTGPYRQELERLSNGNKNIEFSGRVTDEELKKYYSGCRALIFPGEEDFGISPLEAQASGKPVIAFAKGGALETIINEETGLFFNKDNEDSLAATLKYFIKIENKFDAIKIRAHALKFGKEIFKSNFKKYIDELIIKNN
ncbi:MAG: glycosyltransferase [Actinobacteria bacterium]|nr:glycosyltransferase [Actinomycetota bacterium]